MKIQLSIIALCIMFLSTSCGYDTPQSIPSAPIPSSSNDYISQSESEIENSENEDLGQIEIIPHDGPDFRNAKWGMNSEEVKNSETATLLTSPENYLIYDGGTILDFPVSVVYKFKDNIIEGGSLVFNQQHANDNLFYEDYLKIVKSYTEKYGKPSYAFDQWNQSQFKDVPEKYGLAVKAGHVTFITQWETDYSTISVMLFGDNFTISLMATYQPLGYKTGIDTSGI